MKREKVETMSLYDLMAAEAVTNQYLTYTSTCYRTAIDNLPSGYKHHSMNSGTRCDLSYNQGQRDAFLHIKNVLHNVGQDIEVLIDERSDEMHKECNREVD